MNTNKKKNYLFIGNGLNQCLKNSISWGDLLRSIAEKLKVTYEEDISFPLEFERIVDTYLYKNPAKNLDEKEDIYATIKMMIVDKVKNCKLPEQNIHKEILKLKIDGILTTNYDYLLEYVYDPDFKQEGYRRNKYLFNATSTQKGVDFYHVHGFLDSVQSICLGYEHYMGIVENIRFELNAKENRQKNEMKIKKVLFGESDANNTWSELFYTSNIYFVGFGLYECESDIWWLLTHRAYLYYSDYCGLRNKINNKIIYYNTVKDEDRNKTENLNKKKLLKGYDVDVRDFRVKETDYISTYKEIFKNIQKEINNDYY